MARKKKNPDVVPWVLGVGVAGLAGYGVMRWLRGRNQPPTLLQQTQAAVAAAGGPAAFQQRLAAFQQDQQGQQPQQQQGGIMGMSHGIPIVALPNASAQRTQQVRLMRPTVPGIETQQQYSNGGMSPASGMAGAGSGGSFGEGFGGVQGALGGENF